MTFRAEAGRLTLTNGSGATVFDSNDPIQTAIGRFAGTLAFAQRNAPAGWDVAHTIDHDLGAAPAGAAHINGWGKLLAGADLVPAGRAFHLGGTQLLYGSAYAAIVLGVPTEYWTSWRSVTPVIAGGRIALREQWFTHGQVLGAQPVRTLPAFSLEYDLRVSAFLGGI